MKYTLSILLAALLATGTTTDAFAKKDKGPCRNVKEIKDAFSNELTKFARLSISGGNAFWTFVLEKKGEDFYLTVDIQAGSLIEKNLMAGDIIYIKLQNEKIIELMLDADCKPTFQAGYGVSTTWSVRKKVDLKTMKRLSHSLISAAKVKLDDRELILTTNPNAPRAMEAIMDAAICIVGEPVEEASSK